jgi:hypothetical protein
VAIDNLAILLSVLPTCLQEFCSRLCRITGTREHFAPRPRKQQRVMNRINTSFTSPFIFVSFSAPRGSLQAALPPGASLHWVHSKQCCPVFQETFQAFFICTKLCNALTHCNELTTVRLLLSFRKALVNLWLRETTG